MIDIYYSSFKKRLDDRLFRYYLSLLPLDIIDRILRYQRWEDAHASLFGKLLLKKGLGDLGLDSCLQNLKYSKYARPFVDEDVDFNISHSGSFVVCAFSSAGKIGVDLEEI